MLKNVSTNDTAIDIDEISFENHFSEKLEYDDVKNANLLEDAGKELHEGVFVKVGIDSDGIPFENQVRKVVTYSPVDGS